MAYASDINAGNMADYFTPAKWANIGNVTGVLVPLMLIGGGLLFLAMLLFGAHKYMTAGGTAEELEKAKKTMSYAILGFILVITAILIVKVLTWVTDVPFFL